MHRYTVELRITGSNLDPDQVTESLGLAPTQVRRKGEKKSPASSWTTNMWGFEVLPPNRSDWDTLSDGLTTLLSTLEPIRNSLRPYLSANEVYIWCGHFTSSFDGGPSISPNLLKSLADFGAQLVLDTYCEGAK